MIGETMFVTGLAMFFTAPIAGRLSRKVDPRIMMAIGFVGFALGTCIASGITTDWDFYELCVPQILRGVSLMLCMVPINNLALGHAAARAHQERLGPVQPDPQPRRRGRPGVINTVLNNRMDLHLARLRENVTWSSTTALETLDASLESLVHSLGTNAERWPLTA